MTYTLAIGDRGYSSWSLRGWLLFDAFGLPVATRLARLYTDELPTLLQEFFPARTAPALLFPDGLAIGESLAIAEELASRHPEAGMWPADPKARAVARMLASEMHAGYGALRGFCPMNLRTSYESCDPPVDVLADLDRVQLMWTWARETTGATGPWLCGAYSIADVFFAPLATRIATYNLPVGLRLPPMSPRIWRIRPSAAGAPWVWWMAPTSPSTAAIIRNAPGPAPRPCPPAPWREPRLKTPPAPIPANPSPMCLNSTVAASASATPSAETRRWQIPRPGRNSWLFTVRKPFPRSR